MYCVFLALEARGSSLMTFGGELPLALWGLLFAFAFTRGVDGDTADGLSWSSDWTSLNFLLICRNLALAVSPVLYPTFLAIVFQST